MSDTKTLFLDAGRILAGLRKPMGTMETRAFAEDVINYAATTVQEDKFAAVCGFMQARLTVRGALPHQIDLVGRAVLHATSGSWSLTQARNMLGSVWAGVLIVEN